MSTYSWVLFSFLLSPLSMFFFPVPFSLYAEVTPLTSHRFHHVSFHPFPSAKSWARPTDTNIGTLVYLTFHQRKKKRQSKKKRGYTKRAHTQGGRKSKSFDTRVRVCVCQKVNLGLHSTSHSSMSFYFIFLVRFLVRRVLRPTRETRTQKLACLIFQFRTVKLCNKRYRDELHNTLGVTWLCV